MVAEWVEWKPTARDGVITRVQYGEVTPEQAAAEAAENGWEPFERRPKFPEFDPMAESRWSIAMAIAWIAWRDLELVREQNSNFRAECSSWFFREWAAPAEGGTKFERHAGWFLEPWHRTTVPRLALLENIMEGRGDLPLTWKMPVVIAEKVLWRALSEGRLAAEALDPKGKAVDIPNREWSYLRLFEEDEQDVLKYDALDRENAFSQLKLKRDELLFLWSQKSAYEPAHLRGDYLIDAAMIKPVESVERRAYVPLCSALHWIMTAGGSKQVTLDDGEAWRTATRKLFALIHNDDIEMIGLPRGGSRTEKMPGSSLTLVRVLPPIPPCLEDILARDCHIVCSAYRDELQWLQFNDQMFDAGGCNPTWTHLQVRKDGVLKCQPRSASKSKPEYDCRLWLDAQVQQSPNLRPKNKEDMWQDAKDLFPGLKYRQFERAWAKAVIEPGIEAWSKSGPLPKSSVHRTS